MKNFIANAKPSILAGMLIAFGGIFSMHIKSYGNLVQGLCFSLGLFGVLLTQAKLFTGSILNIQDIWNDKNKISSTIYNWIAIYIWNFIGAILIALIVYITGHPEFSIEAKISQSWVKLIFNGFLCNFLICMAVWIYRTYMFGSDNQFNVMLAAISVLLPVACFVSCGFEHCVADMFYTTLALIDGSINLFNLLFVIFFATVGNILGGIAFSWLVYSKNDINR